jgi:hypothetical protein
MGNFQTVVNTVPGVGVAGDFASANIHFSVDAGPGGLIAGPSGLTVGAFAWLSAPLDADSAPAIANNFGSGPVGGFVHREQQALITSFLSDATMLIPAGFPVTLMNGGDFWVVNGGAGVATAGMVAYANFSNGLVTFGASGAPTTGATLTTATIAAGTAATFTGTISGNVLTAGTVTNVIYLGARVTGTGVTTNTLIVSQLTGVAGAAGTYIVSIGEQNVASTALTATPFILAGTGSGVVVGQTIASSSGANVGGVIGATVTQLNLPSAGSYPVAPVGGVSPTTAASGTIVLGLNVATKWVAMSSGLAGELIKISDHLLG